MPSVSRQLTPSSFGHHSPAVTIVESQSEGMKVERGKKEFIARFYSFAFVAFGLDWIRRGMKEEPKDIIDQIGTLVEGDIYKALKKYEIEDFA
jgi:hypothetical protein